jgi:adenylate cyclase
MTRKELLTLALKWEECARDGYARAATVMPDPAARDMLLDLSDREAKHVEKLQSLLRMDEKLRDREGGEYTAARRPGGLPEAGEDFEAPPAPSLPIPPDATPKEILWFAIKAEEDAAIFYQAMAQWFDPGEARHTLDFLAREEIAHKIALQTLLTRLGREVDEKATQKAERISTEKLETRAYLGETVMIKPIEDVGEPDTVSFATLDGAKMGLTGFLVGPRKTEEDRLGRRQRFLALSRLAMVIASAGGLDEILEKAMDLIFSCLPAERGVIELLDPETGRMCPRLKRIAHHNAEETGLLIDTSIARRAAGEMVSIITGDACRDPRFKAGKSPEAIPIRSALCTPIWDEGGVCGLIYLDNLTTPDAFAGADRDLLVAMANQIALAVSREELKEKIAKEEQVRRSLERYQSPEVIDLILHRGKSVRLEVITAEVTVFFVDIEGFSQLSERLPAHEIAGLLNRYFEICTEAVAEHRGTVNKFIGDAVMAVFGAPQSYGNDAELAIQASLAILERLAAFRRTLPEAYRFHVRVGMNTGEVVVGNIGSKRRMEYTVIGDVVNTASRMEKIAAPDTVVIGEETEAKVRGLFPLRDLGFTRFPGMSKEMHVYQVLAE